MESRRYAFPLSPPLPRKGTETPCSCNNEQCVFDVFRHHYPARGRKLTLSVIHLFDPIWVTLSPPLPRKGTETVEQSHHQRNDERDLSPPLPRKGTETTTWGLLRQGGRLRFRHHYPARGRKLLAGVGIAASVCLGWTSFATITPQGDGNFLK